MLTQDVDRPAVLPARARLRDQRLAGQVVDKVIKALEHDVYGAQFVLWTQGRTEEHVIMVKQQSSATQY